MAEEEPLGTETTAPDPAAPDIEARIKTAMKSRVSHFKQQSEYVALLLLLLVLVLFLSNCRDFPMPKGIVASCYAVDLSGEAEIPISVGRKLEVANCRVKSWLYLSPMRFTDV
ncbi:hypothetical protein CRG98_038741 [Punica granatum]|uniref:Uncharacterized protein n=1 Tax=Punica granatum TaxID=22663 RepID=A0A2I0IA29_PUNGR|nr:hypothetical protein CRG98_038741 [Punica granatum]